MIRPERLSVKELLSAHGGHLGLKLQAGEKGLTRAIEAMEVNRPGLALLGHLEHFRAERIQVLGRGEQSYLCQASPSALSSALGRIFNYSNLPCFVVTRNEPSSRRAPAGVDLRPSGRSCSNSALLPGVFVRQCEQRGIPLLSTPLETAFFIGELHSYLEERLALAKYVHGVLVDVYGLGVLICGKSGVGKSECALELLKRGHFFIGDDLIQIKRLPGEILAGAAARREFSSYMEVRGLGIIDVKSFFGIGSVMDKTRVELAVTLELWNGGRRGGRYERVGLVEKTKNIFGMSVPHVVFPVFPGRNLAVLLEVASLNQRLKAKGINVARNFEEKLLEKTRAAV